MLEILMWFAALIVALLILRYPIGLWMYYTRVVPAQRESERQAELYRQKREAAAAWLQRRTERDR